MKVIGHESEWLYTGSNLTSTPISSQEQMYVFLINENKSQFIRLCNENNFKEEEQIQRMLNWDLQRRHGAAEMRFIWCQ